MHEQQGASGGSLDGWIKEQQTIELIKEEIDGDLIVKRDPNQLSSPSGTPGHSGISIQARNVNRGTSAQRRAKRAKRRAQRASRKKNR